MVLADFQLFNKPVKVGSDNSPLSTSITYADHLVLEHKHSIFSLSVATLNYANPSKININISWKDLKRLD